MRKMFSMLATASALLVSCQTTPGTNQSTNQIEYDAHGTEPFWGLTIKDGVISLSVPDDEDIRVTDFKARRSSNGWRYASPTITVDTRRSKCSDGMSDWTFRDKVTVKFADFELKGCGGGILPPETLEGTNWRVMAINDATLQPNIGAEFSFADGRMSGSVGCNRLGADYKFARNAVSFGPVMSTKMACPDPVGKQEYAFVTVLGHLASTAFPGDGSMVLTGRDGGKIVLMQSI